MKEKTDIKYISNLIWNTGRMLSGVMSGYATSQVLLTFLFLRRIDCMIGKYAKQSKEFYQENKDRFSDEKMQSALQDKFGGYPFYNVSGLNFNEFFHSGNSIDITLENYFQGFSDNVKDILEGMQFRSNMAMLQRQSHYIELLLRTFRDLDLSEPVVTNEELIDLFYVLIVKMDDVSSFEYVTPSPLAKLMTELIFSYLPPRKDNDAISIYDPVCGMGGLLAKAYFKAVYRLYNPEHISLYGQDISIQTSATAKIIALLMGNENSVIYHGDTLINDMFPERKFDFILADMPFGLSWKHIKPIIEAESVSSGRFTAGLPVINDSQFLFIEHMVSKMALYGRVIFATTGSVLWSGSASSGESRIRRWLFEKDIVDSIISLPKGVLTQAKGLPLYIWVLSNYKDEKRKGKTMLINACDFMESGSRKSPLDDKAIDEIVNYYKEYSNSYSSLVVPNDQFGYYEISYTEEGDKKKKSVSFGLSTKLEDYFKFNVIPFAKGKITIDYTSVGKGYAIDFNKFFDRKESIPMPSDISQKSILPLLYTFSSFNSDVENVTKMELSSEEDISKNTSGWEEYPLDYLANLISGAAKPKNQDGHGLPFITIPYLRDRNSEVEKYEWKKDDEKVVGEDDVLIVARGYNVGEVFKGINGIASNNLTIIRPQSEDITPKYLYYLMKGYEDVLRNNSNGDVIKSLDTKAIRTMKFKVPPIIIQEKIVSFLDDIDNKVDFINSRMGSLWNVFSDYRQSIIVAAIHGKLKIS